MARIRSVHPDLHRDKTLAQASASAERTFVRLWCHLDDEGRGEDDPDLMKADLYPRHREMDADAIDRDLRELAGLGLVVRYAVAGERYIACKPETWSRYQKPQKKQDSKLPGIDEADDETDTEPLPDHADTATEPVPPVGEGRGEGVGGVEEGSLASPPATRKRTKPPKSPDHGLLFDALVEVCGLAYPLPGTEGGKVGRCAKQLLEIGAGPDDVRERARAYRKRWPNIDLTPTGLVGNWGQVVARKSGAGPRVVRDDVCQDCGQKLAGHDGQLCSILRAAS